MTDASPAVDRAAPDARARRPRLTVTSPSEAAGAGSERESEIRQLKAEAKRFGWRGMPPSRNATRCEVASTARAGRSRAPSRRPTAEPERPVADDAAGRSARRRRRVGQRQDLRAHRAVVAEQAALAPNRRRRRTSAQASVADQAAENDRRSVQDGPHRPVAYPERLVDPSADKFSAWSATASRSEPRGDPVTTDVGGRDAAVSPGLSTTWGQENGRKPYPALVLQSALLRAARHASPPTLASFMRLA